MHIAIWWWSVLAVVTYPCMMHTRRDHRYRLLEPLLGDVEQHWNTTEGTGYRRNHKISADTAGPFWVYSNMVVKHACSIHISMHDTGTTSRSLPLLGHHRNRSMLLHYANIHCLAHNCSCFAPTAMDSAARAVVCPSLTSSYAGLSQRRPFFALYHYRACNFLSIAYAFSNLVSMIGLILPQSLWVCLIRNMHITQTDKKMWQCVTYPFWQ